MAREKKSRMLSIRATPAQVERYQAAARSQRRDLPDWIRIELDDAAERVLQRTDKEGEAK